MKGLFLYDESLYKILPDELIKDIGIYAGFQHVREIRLRTGRLPAAICDNGEHRGAVPVDEHMITRILSIATNYSSYAYESCMANGFLTIKIRWASGSSLMKRYQIRSWNSKISYIFSFSYF